MTSLHAATLPRQTDPARALTQTGSEGLRNHLTQLTPLANFIVDNRVAARTNVPDNAEARVACLRELSTVIARMKPDDATRQSAGLPGILGLDHETVTRELVSAVCPPTATGPTPPNQRAVWCVLWLELRVSATPRGAQDLAAQRT